MKRDLCIAILAGGRSKRIGLDKAMLLFNQIPLLDLVYGKLKALSENIIVIGNTRRKSIIPADHFITDIVKDKGPLGGLYTALKYCNRPVLLTSCDMPFLKTEHYHYFINQIDHTKLATVAKSSKGLEPLLAMYTPALIPLIENCMTHHSYAIYQLFEDIDVKIVDFDERSDNTDIFFNINTLSDYKKALYLRE